MSDFRVKTQEEAGRGVRFEVHDLKRRSHAPLGMSYWQQHSVGSGDGATTINVHHAAAVQLASRQLRVVLEGGSALLEPGALQYARGQIDVQVQQASGRSGGNFLSRMVASAGSGESAYATRYAGHGEVWTEPTQKHFLLATMDGPADALLLDDKAFYACEGTISVQTHVHRSVQGVLSGNGLMQPKLEGSGVFVVECPVPAEEIEAVDLDGRDELIVDGDLMLMYSANLSVELRPLVRGLRNTWRSGEGLVYVLRGRGTVWLTPTARLGH